MHRFPDGQLKAIAHASKTLTSTEQNCSQIEREALALVFTETKFRRMLLGRQFTLQTDHQPLLKVFGSRKGIPLHTANRLQRWALSMLGFDFNVEYRQVRLSRCAFEADQQSSEAGGRVCRRVNQSTRKDATLQQVVQFIDNGWPRKIEDPKLKAFHSRRESLSVVNGCIMMEDRDGVPVDHHHGDSSDNDEFFEAGSTVSSPVQPATVKTPRPVRNSRLPKRLEDYDVG
ncbi:uncharacterized protein LOC129752505 [Uranotaenia lowii]|uniref:uncharacterized protein LOC129752505 n=1 Tax=Uranotaenia lowii TaxID=190385 RepID=UPI00247A6BB2|nr:uncharacterized protein LOC129752505 [Uranotaenia lowii]